MQGGLEIFEHDTVTWVSIHVIRIEVSFGIQCFSGDDCIGLQVYTFNTYAYSDQVARNITICQEGTLIVVLDRYNRRSINIMAFQSLGQAFCRLSLRSTQSASPIASSSRTTIQAMPQAKPVAYASLPSRAFSSTPRTSSTLNQGELFPLSPFLDPY